MLTFKEQGFGKPGLGSWLGVVVPAKTPPDVVARLNADILEVVRAPNVKAKLVETGFPVTGISPDEFARVISADTAKWSKVPDVWVVTLPLGGTMGGYASKSPP